MYIHIQRKNGEAVAPFVGYTYTVSQKKVDGEPEDRWSFEIVSQLETYTLPDLPLDRANQIKAGLQKLLSDGKGTFTIEVD